MADENKSAGLAAAAATSALDALRRRTLIEGRWFHDKDINLDGYDFKRCRFDNCALHSETGDFRIIECRLEGSYFLPGDSGLIAIRAFHVDSQNVFAFFGPVRHADGTVTIDAGMRDPGDPSKAAGG